MRKNLILASSLMVLLLFVGCSAQPELVDETAKKEDVKTVQETAAKATQKDDSSLNANSNDDGSQDQNELLMDSTEGQVETVFFDFDKFNIRADMREIVEKNGVIINNDTNKEFRIKLEGNCDEWGSDEYNFALGLKRAEKTKEALISQGVNGDRIGLVSFGEANPLCSEKTQECWSKNRRVDFKILP